MGEREGRLETWIAHQEDRGETAAAAMGRTLLDQIGDLPLSQKPSAGADRSPITQEETKITPEFVRRIMGKDFIRPDTVRMAVGREVKPAQLSRLLEPLDLEMLLRIKELGGFLSLRTDRAGDGSPLTAQWMHQHLEQKLVDDGKGKIFYNTDWYNRHGFFRNEAARYGEDGLALVLVTKDVVKGTTKRNYADQTVALADFLKDQVYASRQLPDVYQEAIDEFMGQREELTNLQYSDWKKAAIRLSELPLNILTRGIFAERIYDSSVYLAQNDERLLPNTWDWTRSRTSDDRLVYVGDSVASGAYVDGWYPDGSDPGLGVCASLIVSQI